MNQTFKRAMSLMLALAMVASMVPSFGTHVHAEELETEPVVVTEAPATEVPVVETPVEEVPETEAPTQAPETEAPATEAPAEEPEVVETEAPVVTEEATEAPEVETEPVEETEAVEETTPDATEETIPEEIFEEELIEEEAAAADIPVEGMVAYSNDSAKGLSITYSGFYSYYEGEEENASTPSPWTVNGANINGELQGLTFLDGKRYRRYAAKSTLTLTNTNEDEAMLYFEYTVPAVENGSVTVNGIEYTETANDVQSVNATLKAGESVEIVLNVVAKNATKDYPNNTAAISISNVSLATQSSVTLTFAPAENGTYTVNDNAVTETTEVSAKTTDYLELEAAPNEGYAFAGWYNVTTGKYFSADLAYENFFTEDCEITAKFILKEDGVYGVGDTVFMDLTDAAAAAYASTVKTVVLLKDATLSGAHTIPAGVTLLIPYDESHTLNTEDPDSINATYTEKPSAFRTLTMESGASITVDGDISVNARHLPCQGSQIYGGTVYGQYGAIYMNSGTAITMNKGSNLYAWGYIWGKGTVTAKSGATIYEKMQVTDYRGGSFTAAIAMRNKDCRVDGVFPFNQYYIQNVEVKEILEDGAKLMAHAAVFLSGESPAEAAVEFIGSDAAMFASVGATITKQYNPATDRLAISIDGDSNSAAGLNGLSLDMAGMLSINSSMFSLPINSNIDININAGEATICQELVLQPGVKVNVGSAATLVSAENIYVMDVDQWGKYVFKEKTVAPVVYSPSLNGGSSRTIDSDAVVDINGLVIIESGGLYTTEGGARIISSGKTGEIELWEDAPVPALADGTGDYTVVDKDNVETVYNTNGLYQVVGGSDLVQIGAIPALLTNANPKKPFTETEGASADDLFFYCTACDTWHRESDECAEVTANYQITWNFGGGKVDDKEYCTEEFEENVVPEYKGATPVKAETAQYTYTFAGWMDADGNKYATGTALPAATADVTYTAYYTETVREYKITWLDVNGDPIYSVDVAYGEMPAYDTAKGGELGDACHVLSWTPAVVAVTGEASYQAVLTESHSFTNKKGEVITAGTCMAEAIYELVCDNCDAVNGTVKGEKDSANHTGNNTVKGIVEATCGAEGYTGDTYCECGEKIKTGTSTSATGEHVDGDDKNHDCDNCSATNVDDGCYGGTATCMAAAVCDECGKSYGEKDPTNHTGNNTVKGVVEATCGAEGYTGDTYCECGEKIKTGTSTPATGEHNYTIEVEGTRVDATCMATGSVTKQCACGAENTETLPIDMTNHTKQNTTVKDAADATCGEYGYTGDTYCECGEKIADGEDIPATGDHKFTVEGSRVPATCTTPGSVTWQCENCKATETEELEIDYKNHASDEFSYNFVGWDENGNWVTTHEKSHACCGNIADEAEPHDFDSGETDHTCICSAVEQFTLTVYAIQFANGDEAPYTEVATCEVPYGADLSEYLGVFPDLEFDIYQEGHTEFVDGKMYSGSFNITGWEYFNTAEAIVLGTMPAEDLEITQSWNFTGWYNDYSDENGELTDTCFGTQRIEEDKIQRGWFGIDYGEGGDCDWYYLDPVTGYRAEGITRVPYPTEPINGITYGPNAEDMANTEYEYTDATEAWFIFVGSNDPDGNSGKFLINYSGPANTQNDLFSWAVKGMIPWHVGLIELEENVYAYFIGDEVSGGNVMATGDVYVTRVASDIERSFALGGVYTFGDDGLLIEYDGIVDMTNGTKRYYDDAQLMLGAGLVEVPIDDEDNYRFIYVRSNGELVVNDTYWVAKTNEFDVVEGMYAFDENGYMIDPLDSTKNGVYEEDGGLFYYENGKRVYKGLIAYGDGYIYVRSNGQLAVGRYWVTVVNDTGFAAGFYVFDENGYMEEVKNGFVHENGSIYYYVTNQIQYNAGVIEVDGNYYYVRSNGEVVHDRTYWVTNVGDSGVLRQAYEFDIDGVMQNPQFEADQKGTGVYEVDGVLYYYVDGNIAYAAGLIKLDGGYIYVKSNGQLAIGDYWITNVGDTGVAQGMYTFGDDGYMITA